MKLIDTYNTVFYNMTPTWKYKEKAETIFRSNKNLEYAIRV